MFVILIFALLLVFLLSGVRVHASVLPDGTYMSRERTSMINGFFIWIVFMSHMKGYGVDLPEADRLVVKLIGYLGQCCVATFFFYSGFGIMASLRRKGSEYAKALVCRRLPMLLLHMSLAVLVFWGVQALYGAQYEWSKVLLSMIAWDSIGNSNWFIFVSLSAYLIVAVAYALGRKLGEVGVISGVILLFLLLIVFLKIHKGSWWYDTCLCIPAGMLFFVFRPFMERIFAVLRVPVWIYGMLLVPLSLFIYSSLSRWPYLNNFSAILFALGVTLLFSCVELKRNPSFLCWCGGSALFYLYIFQRIPMMIGAGAGWHTESPFMYELFCVVGTLANAWVACRVVPFIDRLIFRGKA